MHAIICMMRSTGIQYSLSETRPENWHRLRRRKSTNFWTKSRVEVAGRGFGCSRWPPPPENLAGADLLGLKGDRSGGEPRLSALKFDRHGLYQRARDDAGLCAIRAGDWDAEKHRLDTLIGERAEVGQVLRDQNAL